MENSVGFSSTPSRVHAWLLKGCGLCTVMSLPCTTAEQNCNANLRFFIHVWISIESHRVMHMFDCWQRGSDHLIQGPVRVDESGIGKHFEQLVQVRQMKRCFPQIKPWFHVWKMHKDERFDCNNEK